MATVLIKKKKGGGNKSDSPLVSMETKHTERDGSIKYFQSEVERQRSKVVLVKMLCRCQHAKLNDKAFCTNTLQNGLDMK